MEQVIEFIRAEPIKALGAFIIVMAALSVSGNVISQVKAHFKYESKFDSAYSRDSDKWGN